MVTSAKLIFDLGLFEGSDTAFYLRKGFRVVAVEARPDLCALARAFFAKELATGQLAIKERAIWTSDGERIPFYVRSGWSSVFRSSAERDGGTCEIVHVLTTTVDRLFEEFGVPYYLKADIEAAEQIVIDAIARSATKPAFVSVEDSTGAVAARLHSIGYDRFQMVNQGYLNRARRPRRSREGRDVEMTFDGKCSGFFGHDLPRSHWVDFHRVQSRMNFWNRLRRKEVNKLFAYGCRRVGKLTGRGWLLGAGWSDIHATTAERLG